MINDFCIRMILVILLVITVSSQVIGIDFGTQFWKAALISPGKNFVVVQNSRSQRKTPNGISFIDGVRLFESEAVSKKGRYPKSTFTDLNQLLPLLDSPTLQLSNGNTFKFANGTLVFQYQNGKQILLEQLLGMIFKNIKTLASKQAGTQIKDCVITVPSNWGFQARNAIINSAYIGDLSVMSVITQNTAAALNYAMARIDEQSTNVMIFNLGSYNLQISIVRFYGLRDNIKNKTIQSVQVLSHEISNQINGYIVDQIIANIAAKSFNSKYKKNVQKNFRAWNKLLQKSTDIKETLSANKQANFHIQSLMDGIDLNTVITRSQIQQSPAYDKITQAIQSSLEKADISKYSISSVQLIGGASRIPKVISKVSQYFPSAEVGTHINGDQAMALGSVLHAANMSKTFRVKDIHLYDGYSFPISIKIKKGDEQIYNKVLFKEKEPIWSKKEIELNQTQDDLSITLLRQNQVIREYRTLNLSNWKAQYQNENITRPVVMKINLVLSSVNIVDLKEIYLNIYKNQSSVRQVVDYVKQKIIYNKTKSENQQNVTISQQTNQKSQNNTTQNQPQKSSQTPKSEQQNISTQNESVQNQTITQDTNNTATNETISDTNSTSNTSQTNKTQKKKKLPKYKTVTVKNNVTQYKQKLFKYPIKLETAFNKYHRIIKSEIIEKARIIRKFQKFENGLKQKAKVKNELQSRLYDLRRSFDQKYMIAFSTPPELQNLKKVIEQELLWLQDNSYDGTKQDFQQHLNIVFEAYLPIYNRTVQYQHRGKTVNETIEFLGQVYQKAAQLNRSSPWVQEKALNLMAKVNETYQWYKSKLQQQQKMPLNQDPVFYNYQPIKKAQKLRDEYYLLKMIPRPKPSSNTAPKQDGNKQNEEEKKQQQKKEQQEVKEQNNNEQTGQKSSKEQPNGSETQL